MSAFRWTESSTAAAIALAEGYTQQEAATKADITDRTIRRWLQDPEFTLEVDRLSLMVGIAARAERLRIAQQAVRMRMPGNGIVITKADLLDWLKFAQSETDGIKLDLAAAFTAAANAGALAGSGQTGSDRALPAPDAD